jgi:hygromycin-B 4-O-kinase
MGGQVTDITPVGHGEWSSAFTFRHAGDDYVARFSTFEDDFRKDQLAAIRYASRALPIPRILEVGQVFDGFYAISERAAGGFIDTLDEQALRRLLPSLFGVLDAVRQADVSRSSGFGLWQGDGSAPHSTWRDALLDVGNDLQTNRTYGWRARLAASPIGDGPFDGAFRRLQSLVEACPEERHLIHSDMLNYNVLTQDDRVTAVIDWGSSMYGDFLFDVAWFSFWQPWYPAWSDIDFAEEARRHYAQIGLDVPNFGARLRCYETYIGLDSLAYNAFKGRWENQPAVIQRTLAVSDPSHRH